ncbi:MAG: CdaR family protein [Clostridia bacterium]|nr:CdaR family protein [Clostridia bacterium]
MKVKTEKKDSFVKRHNIIPKAACVLVAFIIWIYVMEVDSPDHQETFEDVPVTITGLSELDSKNLSVFSGQDTVVDVTVKGQKSVIAKNSVNDITVTADVSGITEAGSYTLNLNFDVPSGLTFTQSSVTELKLFIDRRTSVNLSLQTKLSSYQVPSGYELGEISCDTDTVTVTGAETVLRDISYALVDVNMADRNLTESFTTDGTVILCDSADNTIENRYIKLSQNTAKVTVPVYTFKEVTLRADCKYGYYNADNTEITVEPKTITVKGDKSVVESLKEISVTTLNEKTLREDTKLSVDITLPDGVYPVSGQPTTADVNVKFKDLVRRSLTVKNITVKNAGNIKYEVMTNALAVDLIGEMEAIKGISADNVSLTVDLNGYESGSSPGMIYPNAEVTFTKVNGVVYELGTYNVQVLIG